MTRRYLVWFMVSCLSLAEAAEDCLFVSSEPFGATVTLDGVELERRTPLLLREIAPGSHELRIAKIGWATETVKFEVPNTDSIAFNLRSVDPLLRFEGVSTVLVNGVPVEQGRGVLLFKPGSLRLESAPGEMRVGTIFGQQWLLDGVRLALPLFIGLTGVLTAREIMDPRGSDFVIAPELGVSAAMSAGLLGLDIALEVKRKSSKQSYRVVPVEASWSLSDAEARLEVAGAALAQGSFDLALQDYEGIAYDFPDTSCAPRALYEIGRLKLMRGDSAGAALAFRAIVESYPVIDLYDRALKGLADCLLAEGDSGGALATLDGLTYKGPGLAREEIDLYRSFIAASQASP